LTNPIFVQISIRDQFAIFWVFFSIAS